MSDSSRLNMKKATAASSNDFCLLTNLPGECCKCQMICSRTVSRQPNNLSGSCATWTRQSMKMASQSLTCCSLDLARMGTLAPSSLGTDCFLKTWFGSPTWTTRQSRHRAESLSLCRFYFIFLKYFMFDFRCWMLPEMSPFSPMEQAKRPWSKQLLAKTISSFHQAESSEWRLNGSLTMKRAVRYNDQIFHFLIYCAISLFTYEFSHFHFPTFADLLLIFKLIRKSVDKGTSYF